MPVTVLVPVMCVMRLICARAEQAPHQGEGGMVVSYILSRNVVGVLAIVIMCVQVRPTVICMGVQIVVVRVPVVMVVMMVGIVSSIVSSIVAMLGRCPVIV